MSKSYFRVIQGNPAKPVVAPYIELIRREIHGTVNSIYRGSDAAPILHAHGKHTQAEVIALHAAGVPGYGPANPVRRSSHCLYNDGVVRRDLPVGAKLPWWGQGWDVNDSEVNEWIRVAGSWHGWIVYRPYGPGSSEYHHLGFRRKPHPRSEGTRKKLIQIRAELPRH